MSIERTDPESEARFVPLADCIAWELGARIAAGDETRTESGRRALAELIAGAVLDRFEVRTREVPRYRTHGA